MRTELYRGKAKTVYSVKSPDVVEIEFTDRTSAFDGAKKEDVQDKGVMNLKMTALLFTYLEDYGIETHMIKQIDKRNMLCDKLDMIPVEIIGRNIAAGSFCKRYGLKEGHKFNRPVYEAGWKNDDMHDPFINYDIARELGLCSRGDMEEMYHQAIAIGAHITAFFKQFNLTLVDFKLEFGKKNTGAIILGDEISLDSIRLWDYNGKKLDKDVFRFDLGNIQETYKEALEKIGGKQV